MQLIKYSECVKSIPVFIVAVFLLLFFSGPVSSRDAGSNRAEWPLCFTVPDSCYTYMKSQGYPDAEGPYVVVNGCNVVGNLFRRELGALRTILGLAQMTPACNKHDRCYSTIGSNAQACNENFRDDLIEQCRHKFGSLLSLPMFLNCQSAALAMYAAVRAAENHPSTYRANQSLAREYHSDIKKFCNLRTLGDNQSCLPRRICHLRGLSGRFVPCCAPLVLGMNGVCKFRNEPDIPEF